MQQVEESEAVVFSTVLFYSLLILLAPLGTFLVTQLTFNGTNKYILKRTRCTV